MNLTIFIMYSPDRKDQLEQMIRLNSRMSGWDDAQKLLLVDGTANVAPLGFDVIEVPRPSEHFNWSEMWHAGVAEADYDTLLYLDSDRVLPVSYLEQVIELRRDCFAFTDSLFGFSAPVSDAQVEVIIDGYDAEGVRTFLDQINGSLTPVSLYYDPRYRIPLHGPGKGAMSGNTAFTKGAYHHAGRVDPWYEGHGAFADTDYHKQVWEAGVEIVDLNALELHLWHPKLSDDNLELTMRDIEILSLDNFIHHAQKWKLSYHYPEAIARYLGLGADYVSQRVCKKS